MANFLLATYSMIKQTFLFLLEINFSFVEDIYYMIIPQPERCVKYDTVLITGSAQGIGKELALQYGNLGATVVCVDIDDMTNRKTVEKFKELNIRAFAYCCDVRDREAVMDLKNKVEREVGEVTILVNNAGIIYCKLLLRLTPEEIEDAFQCNLMGCIWMIQAFLPTMIKRNSGHIVSISSLAGLVGGRNLSLYSSTKQALTGFMESLMDELRVNGHNIMCTTVYPFFVETRLLKQGEAVYPSMYRVLNPSEVAEVVISAQRRNVANVSVPWTHFYLINWLKLYPREVKNFFLKYFEASVNPLPE